MNWFQLDTHGTHIGRKKYSNTTVGCWELSEHKVTLWVKAHDEPGSTASSPVP